MLPGAVLAACAVGAMVYYGLKPVVQKTTAITKHTACIVWSHHKCKPKPAAQNDHK